MNNIHPAVYRNIGGAAAVCAWKVADQLTERVVPHLPTLALLPLLLCFVILAALSPNKKT